MRMAGPVPEMCAGVAAAPPTPAPCGQPLATRPAADALVSTLASHIPPRRNRQRASQSAVSAPSLTPLLCPSRHRPPLSPPQPLTRAVPGGGLQPPALQEGQRRGGRARVPHHGHRKDAPPLQLGAVLLWGRLPVSHPAVHGRLLPSVDSSWQSAEMQAVMQSPRSARNRRLHFLLQLANSKRCRRRLRALHAQASHHCIAACISCCLHVWHPRSPAGDMMRLFEP